MALTNFGQIITEVEREVDGASTTNGETVKVLINRVYRKCLSKIVQLNRDYFLTSTTFSTTVGTKKYSWATLLITDILKPIVITDSNGDPIKVGSIREDVEEIFWVGNSGVGFVETPASVETYTIWYIQRKDDMTADAAVPAIEQIHFDILYWGACYLFFLWKKNKELAAFYKSFFDEAWADFVEFHTTQLSNERVMAVDDGLN